MKSHDEASEHGGILSRLFDSESRARILDFYLDHKEFDYPISEIAEKCGLSIRHVLREMPKLERMKIIIKSRKVGKASMYRLDTNLAVVTLLDKLTLELSRMPSIQNNQYKIEIQAPIDEVVRDGRNDGLLNEEKLQNRVHD